MIGNYGLISTTTSSGSLNRTSGTGKNGSMPSTASCATEPERIRALYEVKAQRIEPVGLVYLWPVSG